MSEENNEQGPVEANFLQFLSGYASQALMHLGMMTNPMTGKTEVDLANAKYSIDLLEILQQKTEGNLTDEEDAYLKAALYELRMRYLQVPDEEDASNSA